MTLHDLESPESISSFTSSNANTVICFSATWCGPCKRSKPDLIAMAESFEKDFSTDVKFGIVYEHLVGNECIQSYGVRAFPTYLLFVQHGKEQKGKVEGPDFNKIRSLIEQAGCKRDYGTGNSLGGESSAALSKEDSRALRLKRFEDNQSVKNSDDNVDPPAPIEETSTKDVAMENAKDSSTTETSEILDNLDKSSIEQLTNVMGFPLVRAQKGLLFGQGNTVEGAVEWLLSHQDDIDIDEPISSSQLSSNNLSKPNGNTTESTEGAGAMKSYKCNDCGKHFSSLGALELHAHQTGHTNFEESTEGMKPLTPEEKAAKVLHLKELLKAKRDARENTERKENIEREKQRRFMGKEMVKTREVMEQEKRKRDAILRKKEKEAVKRERERIRRELEKDKMERRANKGKLTSKLGVDGYNPDSIQYDMPEQTNDMKIDTKPKSTAIDSSKVDEYIKKVCQYRAGGDGGKCLKILIAYVKNVVTKDDEKFRTINMENKVYKAKVKPFIGAKALLMAVGFEPNDDGNALILKEDADRELLVSTKTKLEEALAKY